MPNQQEVMCRVATSSDIPQLCELLADLFEQEVEFQPNAETQKRGLQRIIGSDQIGHILVAENGVNPIGMVSLLYSVSTALGAKVATLEDMVVSPRARGTGIGSALIEYALQFASEHGCQRVTLLTDVDNLVAHKFYQKHGFVRSSMTVFRFTPED